MNNNDDDDDEEKKIVNDIINGCTVHLNMITYVSFTVKFQINVSTTYI